jgi:hypothetical protein
MRGYVTLVGWLRRVRELTTQNSQIIMSANIDPVDIERFFLQRSFI